MNKSLEDSLLQAIKIEDIDIVKQILSKGANPNKTISHGKTCLGEAANIGNIDILKLLISESKPNCTPAKVTPSCNRKRLLKCHKRKLPHDNQSDGTNTKYKNSGERSHKPVQSSGITSQPDRNQGYFVFIHSDEISSNDDSCIANLRTALSPTALTPSPQADLEWDEDIGNVAPTTSEDETWTSMYKWYAAILESTGAAIASASSVTNGIDQQDAFARTALHYAAEQGHIGVVKLLLDAGCKVDISASDGLTPLHLAVIKNDKDIVMLLLVAGCNVNCKTHEKMTPLHFAASRGFLDLVKVLVNNGAYLEARDTSERTALYLAAGRRHVDIVKHLISCGANVNGEDVHGYTPLCEAVWDMNTCMVEVLLKCGARIIHSHRLLHDAIVHRQEAIVELLTKNGGGINLHNDYGDTPMLLAVRTSQINLVEILLQNGGNANARNAITGSSALHIAVEHVPAPDVFEALLRVLVPHGASLDAAALTGDTPLNRALLLNKDHAATLLIQYGADVNACDQYSCGLDNLSIASKRKSNTLARLLLKAGHCSVREQPARATDESTAYWLYHTCKQPLSLTDICRIEIRRMGRNKILFRYIDQLPLPNRLKKMLMLQDEG